MRTVIQRVLSAVLRTDTVVRQIGAGVVALVGIESGDSDTAVEWLASKVPHLRLFEDDAGKMNRSVIQIGGAVLLVPNFTLAGEAHKGRRPSFDTAMPPELAGPMFDRLVARMAAQGVRVEAGVFRAHMTITLCNDGPVTIWLDSNAAKAPQE